MQDVIAEPDGLSFSLMSGAMSRWFRSWLKWQNAIRDTVLRSCSRYCAGWGMHGIIKERTGYCLLKLNFRRKGKQRLPVRNPAPVATPEALNQSWSIDFMHDTLMCGRRFRTFNVIDDFNREALAIEIDLNIPAQRVVRVLDRIVASRGYPLKLRMDYGPELISLTLAQWAEEHGVILEFIRPGKPTQNAFIERFNRTYRTEILDFYLFRTLNEVREITECWLTEYNSERPHESLNNLTREEYRLMAENPEISKSVWN